MDTNLETALSKLNIVQSSYFKWKSFSLKDRIAIVLDIKKTLLENKEEYAKAITSDMNKPIKQSIAEVEKCAYLCDYYANNAEQFLEKQIVKTRWTESFITFEPLGVLLGVMPWNFPFWQVFRFVIPSLLVGNTFVVKHASNVPKSAQMLEEVFNSKLVNFPLYLNLTIKGEQVKDVIANPIVKAVSLTGSENAGKSVAEVAGKHLKKCVLELGGSNAFIVLNDANLDLATTTAVNARMQNAGQSCIAGKRFLVQEEIYNDFIEDFKMKLVNLKYGDKFDEQTDFGSMAREDLAIELEEQVNRSIELGAVLECGGNRIGAFFEPTILSNVTMDMPVGKEETFGPVAAIFKIKDLDEAIEISNQSEFGLGVSIFTENVESVKDKISSFEEGAVFINEMVISDPNMPFGGINKSGYGRELSHFALYEFANIKSVVIK